MAEDYGKYKSWFSQPLNILESKDSNDDYLNNNFKMIDYYQNLYYDGIVIEDLINKLKQGQFDNLSIIDLNRFRIFLDAVLLTFNNEKVYNVYLKDKFAFQPFFDRLNNPKLFIREQQFLNNYKKYLNNLLKIRINKFDSFFYSLDGEDRRVWDQFKIVRNAFSHMQYGFYASDSTGFLSNFSIYNHDNGQTKEIGFVFEPILHLFIQQFFSNYSTSGISYKHSWFEIDPQKKTVKFNEVTLPQNFTIKYSGFDKNHPMNQFTDILQSGDKNKIEQFIKEYNLDYQFVDINNVDFSKYCKFYLNRSTQFDEPHFFNQIKFLFDFETEFSNFLVHLIQLNDLLINYLRDRYLEVDRLGQIINSLKELQEDADKFLCFKYSFEILRMFNIASRMEDDDLPKINYSEISVQGIFLKNPLALYNYYQKNKDKYEIKTHRDLRTAYIVERLRNAIMHGRYWIELKNGIVTYIFEDKFNHRSELLEVPEESLLRFINQDIFKIR